jgi:hypothetical protein
MPDSQLKIRHNRYPISAERGILPKECPRQNPQYPFRGILNEKSGERDSSKGMPSAEPSIPVSGYI